MFNDRQYIIFSVNEVDKIDFTKICETSVDTLRKSMDETKTFIKWEGEQPDFVSTLSSFDGPYSNEEILEILNTTEWAGEHKVIVKPVIS